MNTQDFKNKIESILNINIKERVKIINAGTSFESIGIIYKLSFKVGYDYSISDLQLMQMIDSKINVGYSNDKITLTKYN
jgi:hypothetical protein